MPRGARISPVVRPVSASRAPNPPRAPLRLSVASGPMTLVLYAVVSRPRTNADSPRALASAGATMFTTPPSASLPYRTLAGPLITSICSAFAVSTLGEWSCPHCCVSERCPLSSVTMRLCVRPRITGLPMPVVIESERTPGSCSSASPTAAPCARRSSAPPTTDTGCGASSTRVALSVAVTCTAWMTRAESARVRRCISVVARRRESARAEADRTESARTESDGDRPCAPSSKGSRSTTNRAMRTKRRVRRRYFIS